MLEYNNLLTWRLSPCKAPERIFRYIMGRVFDQAEFLELSYYSLSHPDTAYFIHQLVVDAFTAQTAHEDSKAIAIVFALVGLYLLIEKDFTGRQVQLAHVHLSRYKAFLPEINLPAERGTITIQTVLNAQEDRDEMIHQWCHAVWKSYSAHHADIRAYCDRYMIHFKKTD